MNDVQEILFCLLGSIAILYAWALLCFIYYRFSQSETESRLRRFLDERHGFYTHNSPPNCSPVTPRVMKAAGLRGWCFLGASLFGFGAEVSDFRFLLGVATLFFGGLMIAWSWYGLRCLRLLGLDSYTKASVAS